MSLTPEQRELRRKGIGASEIAAVAGIHPYLTALDVYLEKIGLKVDEPNRYSHWGNVLEPVIGSEWAALTGRSIVPGTTMLHSGEPWMIATPDFLAYGDEEQAGLECKSRGLYDAHRWGLSGTDVVPDEVAAQCHWGMMVTGLRRWDVAVLLGGNDFRVYTLRYDEAIAVSLREMGHEFWTKHVLTETPPEITPESAKKAQKFVQRLFPHHDDALIEAGPEHDALCHELKEARASHRQAEAVKLMWEARVKAAIGDHAGILGNGYKVTWKQTKDVRKVDWKAVAAVLLDQLKVTNPGYAAQMLVKFTTEEPGSRRFLPTFPGEKDD